jgi:hypothetical protein
VHIANPAWRITENASTPMTLTVDGQQFLTGTAQSDRKGELVIQREQIGNAPQESPQSNQQAGTDTIAHIQELLIWTGFYSGFIDGRAGSETNNAIRDFQSSIDHRATGDLSADEIAMLEEHGSAKRVAAGYRAITDDNIGIRLGIPYALVPPGSRTEFGTNWHSRDDRVQIDTFAKPYPIREIYNNLCCNQSLNPGRKATYKPFNARWFVVTGTDPSGDRRAEFYDMAGEVDGRTVGFAIKYDEAMARDLRPVSLAMASDFVADPRVQRFFGPDRDNKGPGTPNPPELEIPLEEAFGTLQLPVRINNVIDLKFTIDSGAADVAIPADVVGTLFRTGTITARIAASSRPDIGGDVGQSPAHILNRGRPQLEAPRGQRREEPLGRALAVPPAMGRADAVEPGAHELGIALGPCGAGRCNTP